MSVPGSSCAASADDILDQATLPNLDECSQFCFDSSDCNAYTWWNESTPFQKTCFLYGTCDEQVPCYGCSSGISSCIQTPQCFEYLVLDEDNRDLAHLVTMIFLIL